MLRYRADVRSLRIVAAYWALVAWQWFAAPTQPVLAVALVVTTCFFSWFAATITHNTLHTPVFYSRGMNRALQVLLTVSYGFPVSEYVPGHNLSHHRFTQSRKDVMRTTKARYQWNLLNGLLFFVHVAGDVTAANMRYVKSMRRRRPRWFRQFVLETVACWGLKAALFVVDWRKCLLYVVVPHLFALWAITSINFVQHDGCDPDHEYNHSRDFTGKLINWLTCNNGYHTIHHLEPALHWSLRPRVHEEKVAPFIHPALVQKSLIAYSWRTFFVPGKRVRFDGAPYVLPVEGPDEEWFTTTDQPEATSLGAEAEA